MMLIMLSLQAHGISNGIVERTIVLKNKCELKVLENKLKGSLNIRSTVDWECF